MCGIVAYSGHRQAQNILVNGLKRLEYRGYDSAGVAIQNNGSLLLARAKGKLAELERKLLREPFEGTTGIGHTRWATHGAPSELNAHPHLDSSGNFAIVHNGIIENYSLLKTKMESEGIKFKSETDSEIIVQLVAQLYNGNLTEAVANAMSHLEGAFGIVAVTSHEPAVMVGARRGSPLVLGVGEDEYFLASDASAMAEHTQKVVYLNDNDLVEIRDHSFRVMAQGQVEVHRRVEEIEFDAEAVAKGNFEHFMLKEIFEQATTVINATRGRIMTDAGTSKLAGLNLVQRELRSIDRIIIAACGTSYYAGMVGEYVIEDLSGIPVEVEYASEFRYRNPIITDKSIVLCISQSGETADTLAALREAKQKGATVLGICNVVGSSIARETDGGVYLHAGPEIGVASTKAFTSQVTVLTLIALLLGRMRRVSPDQGIQICKAILDLPRQIDSILEQNELIRVIAEEYQSAANFLYLGRGFNYPVALEGALKLKEISYIHAEGYPAAEMKHGPIALIDENMPTVVVAPKDALFDKVLSNMQEVKARGGRIIAITDADPKELGKMADHIIRIPTTLNLLTPILSVIPTQLLAYHIAVLRGCDVDTPRNLAKSVTVE